MAYDLFDSTLGPRKQAWVHDRVVVFASHETSSSPFHVVYGVDVFEDAAVNDDLVPEPVEEIIHELSFVCGSQPDLRLLLCFIDLWFAFYLYYSNVITLFVVYVISCFTCDSFAIYSWCISDYILLLVCLCMCL